MWKAHQRLRAGERLQEISVAAICLGWWAVALHGTAGSQPLPADAAYSAGVARNLVRGLGYTIDWVPDHFGLLDSIRHVPEAHGVLQPLLLAPLFLLFGFEDALVRLPGLSCVALTAAVAFVFARRLFGAGAGLLASLLTLSGGALPYWAWMGTDDPSFAFFFLCTIYLLYRAWSTQSDLHFGLAGVAAGLALLAKQTGFFLLGCFACVLVLDPGSRQRTALRRGLCLFAPSLVCLAVYLARNYAAHGDLMFRHGAYEWIWKAGGFEASFALFEEPPKLGQVLAWLGPGEVARIVGEQLRALGSALIRPPSGRSGGLHLLVLGVPSLAFHFRRRPEFAWLGLLSVFGAVAFVCGLHHTEPRYFLMLLPLCSVSLAGCIALGSRSSGRGPRRRALRAASIALGGAVVVYFVVSLGDLSDRSRRAAFDNANICPRAAEWVRRELPPGDALLSPLPEWVAWRTDRPAVLTPTNGRKALRRVAEHYDVRWVFLLPVWGRQGEVARLSSILERPDRELGAQLAYRGTRCNVYRLELPPAAP